VDWSKADESLLKFTKKVLALRKKHRVFHRRHFFEGENWRAGGKKDVLWFLPNGQEMSEDEWNQDFAKCLALYLSGSAIHEHDEKNNLIQDDNFIWILNASANLVEFQLPETAKKTEWLLVFDTSQENTEDAPMTKVNTVQPLQVQAGSMILLMQLSSLTNGN
jgi:isoamylase